MANLYADVIISIKHSEVDSIFQYAVPRELEGKVIKGMRVQVPFGRRNSYIEGYTIGLSDQPRISVKKIKPIYRIMDSFPIFSDVMIELAYWMKEQYFCSLSSALQCIKPIGIDQAYKANKLVRIKSFDKKDINRLIKRNAHAQLRILNYLKNKKAPAELSALIKDLNISSSSIQSLVQKGMITVDEEEYDGNRVSTTLIRESPFSLTSEQNRSINTIMSHIHHYAAILLHGITGSGKTEVYLRIIEKLVLEGKQVVVLLPEIALTPQMISIFTQRFGNLVGSTHSRQTPAQRYEIWRKAKNNEISIVLGPRSAIFTPFDNLGVIIIDEEHENTYKSEFTPKYHARDVAKKLAKIHGIPLILGSATPSLESYYAAQLGEYVLIQLRNRVKTAQLPPIQTVDMREEFQAGNPSIFSRRLLKAIEENLLRNEQTILFINRRGHSTFVSCRNCGYVLKCEKCSVPYTYHLSNHKLLCHYCGDEIEPYNLCPQCRSKYIKYFGTGTQKVESELKKLLPELRMIRMDLDTTNRKNSYEKMLSTFKNGNADVLIGTQMIAKGHDFPRVSLVGVIAADSSLYVEDFRASERTFQLIAQVSGRAGRGDIPGRVLVQTYTPQHYSLVHAKQHDYESFYQEEIKIREQLNYPPFTHIFTFLFASTLEEEVVQAIHYFKDLLEFYGGKKGFEIIGPAPSRISKINDEYRWRIFVKAKEYKRLILFCMYCFNKFKSRYSYGGTIQYDANPVILS